MFGLLCNNYCVTSVLARDADTREHHRKRFSNACAIVSLLGSPAPKSWVGGIVARQRHEYWRSGAARSVHSEATLLSVVEKIDDSGCQRRPPAFGEKDLAGCFDTHKTARRRYRQNFCLQEQPHIGVDDMPETDLTILCDHTLLENCDRVDPLQQARQLHQQQIAGHDRAARRQRGLGPLEVGMNPLSATKQSTSDCVSANALLGGSSPAAACRGIFQPLSDLFVCFQRRRERSRYRKRRH